MKFTINEDTWRCGGYSANQHGKGPTELLNNEGYMCCLGHIACQLGYDKSDLLMRGTPFGLSNKKDDNVLRIGGTGTTDLAYDAMATNDCSTYNLEERKKALIDLFANWGHEIKFQ